MSSEPRIYRTVPHGKITQATSAIPVVATLRWVVGDESGDVQAFAIAWTSDAVQVEWVWRGSYRTDWVPAADVRRVGQPRRPSQSPPLPHGQRAKRGW